MTKYVNQSQEVSSVATDSGTLPIEIRYNWLVVNGEWCLDARYAQDGERWVGRRKTDGRWEHNILYLAARGIAWYFGWELKADPFGCPFGFAQGFG